MCDIVIYNKIYIQSLIPFLAQSFWNYWNFPSGERNQSDFWNARRSPKSGGWLSGGPTLWSEGQNFQFLRFHSPERGEGLKVDSITKDQWWFNQPCLCNYASTKIQKERVQRAPDQWTHGDSGRRVFKEGMGHTSPPHTLSYGSLLLAIPQLHPFITNQSSEK